MPLLPPDKLGNSPPQTWRTLFLNAFLDRMSEERVVKLCRQLQQRDRTAPKDILNALFSFQKPPGYYDDPLLFQYVIALWKTENVETSDVLLALLHQSDYGPKSSRSPAVRFKDRIPQISIEERVFISLSKHHLNSELPASAWKSHDLVLAVTIWLRTITEYEMGKQLETGVLHTLNAKTIDMYEQLGTLALAILGNPAVRNLNQQTWWKKRRAIVAREMESFDTHVLQWMQSPLAGRLRTLASMPPFLATDGKGRPIFTNQQILSAISEVPITNSRAGLFIWINASLSARSLTDDMSLLAYLHGRYGSDNRAMIVDTLMACFDVLTNAMLRKESRQNIKTIRSFICNKVPILFAMLSGTVAPPMTTEAFIQMAFMSEDMISMEPLAPLTSGATEVRDLLKQVRLEFLQACTLHGLVSETAIATILRDPSVNTPKAPRYTKDGLLGQCANNISRVEALVEDLGSMQGNAAAIAGCIVDTLSNLCISKDSMSLKTVCLELIKKIPNVDIILQYTRPGMLLLPLCTLLNDWVHDQEQTEFAPAYEEFATILLFVLATIHRYDLDRWDIGVMAGSFVARMIDEMSASIQPSELSEEQAAQLAKWIEGLYTVDDHGEISGIGDDVMSHCSPQSFYLLVPTLFEQSVLACRSKALKMKTFYGGLELFLEPFLVPSMTMGLKWLAQHAWENHTDTDIVLQPLEKLLRPHSSSQDTQAMHRAILAIVAPDISESLQQVLQRNPEKKQASELLTLLKPYLEHQLTFKCTKAELDEWAPGDGKLQRHLQTCIRNLITWASNPSNPPNPPPSFSYKEFTLACQILDADVLLEAILSELRQNSFNISVALDVCTTMICALTVDSAGVHSSHQRHDPTSKLLNYIRLLGPDVQTLLKKPQSWAEAITRLSRRIEAQLSMPQLPPIAIPIQMQEQATDQMMHELGLGGLTEGLPSAATVDGSVDAALGLTNASAQDLAAISAVDTSAMDLDQSQIFGDLNLDLNQTHGHQPVEGLENQEEDIFAGLDMNLGDLGDDFSFV